MASKVLEGCTKSHGKVLCLVMGANE